MKNETDEHYRRSRNISLGMGIVIGGVIAYVLAYMFGADAEGNVYGIAGFVGRFRKGVFLFRPSVNSLLGILLGAAVGVAIYFLNYMDSRKRVHYKDDEVAGTGRFMSDSELDEFVKEKMPPDPPVIDKGLPVPFDPEHDKEMYPQTIIMSERMRRHADPRKTSGNNSIMIVGGPGTGKTRFFIKPNILQMNASYVITDPSGETVHSLGTVLRNHGYKIKIFNLSDMKHSNRYNPLAYVKNNAGVQSLIECFINNTTTGEAGGDNQFFVDAEKLLYSACIYYLREENQRKLPNNFKSIVDLVNMSDVKENNLDQKSELDDIFDRVSDQTGLAKTMYNAFKQGAGKTLRSIIISCLVRLRPFMVPEIQSLTESDDLELDRIAFEKTALFIITPQGDDTYSFLASMLYSQLFDTLYSIGDQQERETGNASLPVHVRCMMDEFVNIGEIPDFTRKLSTMRKYNISASIVIQGISQIEAKYKDEWRTMIDDCGTTVFLGGNEQNTVKYFSELLGKMTVRIRSNNITSGSKGNGSEGYQNTGREVMTPDEIRRMPSDECIVYMANQYAVRDKKYPLEKHPYYSQTADCNEANAFDYTKDPNFDIERNSYSGTLRASREAAEFRRREAEKAATPKPSGDVFVEVEGAAIDWIWDRDIKDLPQKLVQKCVFRAMQEPPGDVCVITVKDVPTKFMPDLVTGVSRQAKTPRLIIINDVSISDDDPRLWALGADWTGEGLRDISKTEYSETYDEFEKNGIKFFAIKITVGRTADEMRRAFLERAGEAA